jgi:DNA polymerase III subunit gamma/tau
MHHVAHVSLYRKYRSQTFAEILGQEHISTTLANAVREDRVAHAYLFTGPRGTGKTSTARILAKALNCARGPTPDPCGVCESCVAIAEGSSLDVFEMDAASHSGVDETREILAGVPLATAGSRKKIYVIDEVHMLTSQSFNALLKTLEEPPDHVIFVLATTEAHRVLPTIVSRTQRFDFRRAPMEILEEHLTHIAKLENIDIEPAAISTIARHAEGSFRDAIAALDQLASLEGRVSEEDAERVLGERDEDAFIELFDAIASGAIGSLFVTLDSLIAEGADVRQLALGALGHARALLLLNTAPVAEQLLGSPDEDRTRLVEQAERFSVPELLRALDLIGKSITEMRNAPNHRLFLEVALTRAAVPETDSTPDGLLGRIERIERRMGIESTAPAAVPVPSMAKTTRRREPKGREPVLTPPGDEAPAPPLPPPAASSGTSPHDDLPAPPEPHKTSEGQPVDGPEHVGLNHVRDAWTAAIKEVNKRSKRVGALLNPSRPVDFDDHKVVVEVQSSFHAGAMSETGNREVLSEALHAALGIRPGLLFAARGAEPEPPRDGSDEAADYSEATPVSTAEHDPIELVKKGLGAEVVEEVGNRGARGVPR